MQKHPLVMLVMAQISHIHKTFSDFCQRSELHHPLWKTAKDDMVNFREQKLNMTVLD